MKKYILFLICLIALSVNAVAEQNRWTEDSVAVSTVAFSSSTVQAFIGRGMIYGHGNSSSSVNSYFEIYDSSLAINLALGAVDNGRRIYRNQNYGVSQTSIAVNSAGDVWIVKPLRVTNGARWLFSDQSANNARLYYYTDEK